MSCSSDPMILVVDDDEGHRYFKAHVLRGAGYRVCEAATGKEGLRRVRQEHPSIVLLDVRLPDMSGLDVCREIKTKEPSTIVLQTSAAFTETSDRAAALDGGADSYLIEPLDDSELLAVVRALLRLHKAERQLRSLNETLEQRVAERTSELAEAHQKLADQMAQRAKAEEALRHAEKLDAIGQLTGGVAHDFNNLLTVVIGNLDLAEQSLSSPASRQQLGRFVGTARRAALDCERLTRQLLAFARRDELRSEVVDLNAMIANFAPLLRQAAGECVTVELSLQEGLWPCRIDPKQFETALLNLAVNARDAMPLGGPISIATRNTDFAGGAAVGKVGSPPSPGAYVQVCVSDKGMGMSQEVLAHAFEPFFTTKDVGEGSGLGLSQVYGFVKQSGGHITIDSTLGRGTCVNLFLARVCETPTGKTEQETDENALPSGSETILVVEDNPLVLKIVVAMLEGLGYRVLLASDGRSALDILEREPGIDLLFTDVIMPNRMTGPELAREARSLRPGLKVLMTSGYAAYHSDAVSAGGEFPAIAKPYRRADLAVRIRQVLDS